MDTKQESTQNTDFFLDPNLSTSPKNSTGEFKKMWDGALYYLRQIWPYVNQFVTYIVYEVTRVIKAVIQIALEQTGLRKE